MGGSRESMDVTLAQLLYPGRTSSGGKEGRHQHINKTFHPKFALPTKCLSHKEGAEIEGLDKQMHLGTHLM